jgi:serine/threonine protein phosphatase PrpC
MKDSSSTEGVAMSRCIGDLDLKAYGLSAEPVIQSFSLAKLGIKSVVLGSDGIWEVMTN